jgi:uncharacterized protein
VPGETSINDNPPELSMSIDFKAKQVEFAAYIRDPESHPMPGDIKKPRMDMYRELFFNNIESFLSSNFPVLRRILSDSEWQSLAQDFFSRHTCKSPYFSEIPEEFLDYLENERNHPDDYPFLLELAHYEWVEMALSIAKEEAVYNPQSTENLLTKKIQLSTLAWPLAYQYPVQRIAPGFLPEQAPEQLTCLIVYRDYQYDVNFIEITPMTYRLLQLIQEHQGISAGDCLSRLAQELNQADSNMIISGGLQILASLAEKGIILMSE